jgi:hypothetical protein
MAAAGHFSCPNHALSGTAAKLARAPCALLHLVERMLLVCGPAQVAQFSYIAIYYATGDIFAYCLLRWVAEVLTVVAVRMPPPGARAPEQRKAKAA